MSRYLTLFNLNKTLFWSTDKVALLLPLPLGTKRMKYAEVVAILSLTLRLASDRPSQTHLVLSASLSTEKQHRLSRAVRALLSLQHLKCIEGRQLQLKEATLPEPILWICVRIMHNNRTEFNNQRGFCFFISLPLKTTLRFTLFCGLQQNITTSTLTKSTEITNQTTSCVSAQPNLQTREEV